jgi:hypothetical protein
MLQKIYWLGLTQSDNIHPTQESRTIFCKHQFPHSPFISRAFAILSGGQVSNAYAWTLIINNCSIVKIGSAYTPVDDVSEQIRRLMILRMNLLFGQSPEEIERYCNSSTSIRGNLVPKKILPNIFSDVTQPLQQEIESLDSWFQKVLSLPRQKYCSLCQALAAYERALHVLSSDPALSYSLFVFVMEALANSHLDFHATWEDMQSKHRKSFDFLFADERVSSIDDSWIDDMRKVLVDVLHPGATRRFVKFVLDHIPRDFFDASRSLTSSPLRKSRIEQAIQNAYILRSSFAHELKPLNDALISESHRAEEIELQNNASYLTLRGLFRLVRSILLEFVERQEMEDLRSHPWIQESGYGVVTGLRTPAYARMKSRDGELIEIKAQSAQNYFEDALQIYQDNYVEHLHHQFEQNEVDSSCYLGIATSGPWAARMMFRFDPSPIYDWKSLKDQSIRLIPQAKKVEKVYLQAFSLLCVHLILMDGGEASWDNVLAMRAFGNPSLGLERFVVDVIHGMTQDWSSESAEAIFNQHLKNRKISLPSRVELACMLEISRLFKRADSQEGRRKWLTIAHRDSALYPNLQNSILLALNSDDLVVDPQEVLCIPIATPRIE